MALTEPLPSPDEFFESIGSAGHRLAAIDATEGAAGNVSVCIGWPIDVRVGRHCSAILQILELWTEDHPERAVIASHVPRYAEVIENGTGAYLHDHRRAAPTSLRFE